jgi:NAD(P)-dependent dehydrogenase (short-subunit alcohol dehydrogenase family)
MISHFEGKTAVLTGAGSGFGLEVARLGAKMGMNLVLCDVQQDALDKAVEELKATGVKVQAHRVDVAKSEQVEAMAKAAHAQFGAPHFVFNNAGVGAGGLIWEHSLKDWEWVVGVNIMGVAHGVRCFTPMMLDAARADASYQGHITNTASMAGILNAPNMGVYNVTKHAVVSLSETLYQDLRLVTDQVGASVLCPYFIPTGISESHRNRPSEFKESGVKATKSQLVAHAMGQKAVSSGKVTAAQVAQWVLDAARENRFYVFSHPKALKMAQTRMEDVMLARNPTDPFIDRPDLGDALRAQLRAE